jgi:predicted DNA-binding transcriptional regulator YafY
VKGGSYPSYEYLALEVCGSTRTAKRDKEFMLERLNMPIAFNREKGGLQYTRPDVEFPFVKISERELLGLAVALQAIEAFQGTTLAAPLRGTLQKLAREVADKLNLTLAQIADAFSFAPLGYQPTIDPKLFETVSASVITGEELEFVYRNFTTKETKRRRVHPVHLKHHGNAWTLLAYDPARSEQRSFVLSRARDARRTGCKFEKTEAHDWKQMVANSIGTYCSGPVELVRLRVNEAAHQLLTEKPAHASQRLTELVDGYAELTMTVAINPELERFVMSWGSDVRVLEPRGLQDTVVRHARQIAAWND